MSIYINPRNLFDLFEFSKHQEPAGLLLPSEIVWSIFQYLSVEDFRHVPLVSRQWYGVAEELAPYHSCCLVKQALSILKTPDSGPNYELTRLFLKITFDQSNKPSVSPIRVSFDLSPFVLEDNKEVECLDFAGDVSIGYFVKVNFLGSHLLNRAFFAQTSNGLKFWMIKPLNEDRLQIVRLSLLSLMKLPMHDRDK